MHAFVIFLIMHLIFIPSTGLHIKHSNTTSNFIESSIKIPDEYFNIFTDFFFMYPYLLHLPSNSFFKFDNNISFILLPILLYFNTIILDNMFLL